ncbi:MAG: LysR family transcriptional regulator [Defluviicoccus sp.]|nr:LysR family transcriptional regulator [Defluviicoccus sp.]MDE0385969.1 LysR family transcriptional regulator [Defluviicoccus sp.]
MSALAAFECAARHGSFSRAALELGATQPAISRHIASLEEQLGTQLFERSRKGVVLTDAGRRFCEAVVTGLGIIRTAIIDASSGPQAEQVVIACSHDASQFFLLPRYEALQSALGENVTVRVLTFQYDARQLPLDPIADLVLAWDPRTGDQDYVVLLGEAVAPVCSPGYAATHAATLERPVSSWGDLTFLQQIRSTAGSVSWDDWFRIVGRPDTGPRYMGFDSYAYVLETAASDRGIALGWRHFVDPYLERGALTLVTDDFVEFHSRYCGYLTERGRNRPVARSCLAILEDCV